MGTCCSTENLNCDIDILDPNIQQEQMEPICFTMPPILRKLFQHFSKKELLAISLVCKIWSTEARNILAKRGGLIAHVRPCIRRCKQLATLASFLQNVDALRISLCGVNVQLGLSLCFPRSVMSPSKRQLEPKYVAILDRLKWRNLSILFGPHWECNKKCQAFLLVKKILEDKCEDLIEISVRAETNLGESFIQEFLQCCNFSRLKTLKLESCTHQRTELDFVKVFLSRAPKLQTIYVSPSLLVAEFYEGSSVVIVPTSALNPCHKFPEGLQGQIRLHSMRIGLREDSPEFNVKTFNRIMPVLLGNSCITLNSITIDLLLLVPLMNFEICFVNVRHLDIGMRNDFFGSYDPAILECVKAFHFTLMFPKANKVHVAHFYGRHISADRLSGFTNAIVRKSEPGRAANIKHLSFHGFFRGDHVQFFAQMFPDVETFSVRPNDEIEIPFGLIWEHWPNLMELRVVIATFIESIQQILNLDSVVCGIFPEEVAELSKHNKEYLEAVNIVPVMPAITCLRELRSFVLDYTAFVPLEDETTDTTLAFSKVTHLIAFARCPHLCVTVYPEELYDRCHPNATTLSTATEESVPNICRVPGDRFLYF